jgi:fused signal recognition particle receptor
VSTDPAARPATGFFAKLKERLNRGKAWLTGDLAGLFSRGIDEEALEELESRLLLADVGVEATERLLKKLRRAPADRTRDAAGAAGVLEEAMLELLAPLEAPLAVDRSVKPWVVLVVGVNGTGKTTTIGKLAYRMRQDGLSVMLAAADTFRAAATEQLAAWAERAGAELLGQEHGADPAAVVHDALTAARARGIDVVLADTAGRLHTAAGLMDQLEKVRRIVRRFDADAPHETLLVLDASQGQNALVQAVEFHNRLGVSGLVITKLDGTAKGGIVLAIAERLGVPIRYVGVGEGIDDLSVFNAREFARALLGEARP